MKATVLMGVLCSAAAPAMGAAWAIDFDIVAGSFAVDVSPDGAVQPDPVTVNADGTFGMMIYASDNHIGQSDTFILTDSDICNSEEVEMMLMGLATVKIRPGSARFQDFAPVVPGHISPGGSDTIQTDAYLEALILVVGTLNTTLDTKTWAGEALDFTVSVNTSANISDSITVNIRGTFGYEIGVTAVTQTLTFDLIVDVVGTAHVVPDPALGGVTALGLGAAGTWLRRRRQPDPQGATREVDTSGSL